MPARIVGEDDVVKAVALRIRDDAQAELRPRTAADRLLRRVGLCFQAGVVVGADADVHPDAIGAAEGVPQLVDAALDGCQRGCQLVVRLVAVEQLADRPLAGLHVAGDVVEVVRGRAQIL